MRKATLDAHVEAVKQVAVADRIVLSKADLVDDADELDALRARLRQINPGAEMLDVGDTETGVAALFDCGLYNPGDQIRRRAALAGRRGGARPCTTIMTTIMPGMPMITITAATMRGCVPIRWSMTARCRFRRSRCSSTCCARRMASACCG